MTSRAPPSPVIQLHLTYSTPSLSAKLVPMHPTLLTDVCSLEGHTYIKSMRPWPGPRFGSAWVGFATWGESSSLPGFDAHQLHTGRTDLEDQLSPHVG